MSSTMQISVVRAELKAWEHEFLANNGRSATREDIKAVPVIADKYKLYKKLTKEAQNDKQNSNSQTGPAPEAAKTPPRQAAPRQNAARAIFSKPNAVASLIPAETKNPFSPTKKKELKRSDAISGPNPFLTPRKHKRTPSPDLFPPIRSSQPQNTTECQNVVNTRKRSRRHDSVSPPPQPNDKRPRADLLSEPEKLQAPSRSQDKHTESGSHVEEEGESSFIEDTPVKPIAGRSFQPLFAESVSSSQTNPSESNSKPNNSRGMLSRSKTMPGGLFGMVKKGHNDLSSEGDLRTLASGKGKGKLVEIQDGDTSKPKRKRIIPGPRGLVPEKDDLFVAQVSSSKNSTASRKRPATALYESDEPVSSNAWGLLPPSPPPASSRNMNRPFSFKGAPSKRQRKKSKLLAGDKDDDADEDETSSESLEVQVVPWRGKSSSPENDELKLEIEPELQLPIKVLDSKGISSRSPQRETLIVDLPEQVQRILDLSHSNYDWEKEEDHMVKDLIKGKRRVIAEVWGAGEFTGESEGSDGELHEEDDWEEEGVPWEVGEL